MYILLTYLLLAKYQKGQLSVSLFPCPEQITNTIVSQDTASMLNRTAWWHPVLQLPYTNH